MDERELRSIVRAAVERHLEGRVDLPSVPPSDTHPSHARFVLRRRQSGPVSADCLIEPSVVCVHCGYCQSYGH